MKSFYRLLCLILWFPLAASAEPVTDTTAVTESRMVEFSVSTTELVGLGLFDPVFDTMYVRDSFNGWEMISMNQISPGVFRTTISIDGPEGDTILFKFYYERPDGKPVFNDGWEIIDERELTEGIFVNRQLVLGPADVPIVLATVPFGVIELHQGLMNVHLAQLNYYEVLNTPSDIANHPMIGVDVRFTAVVSGMALNSGFAGLNAALGVPARLHLFVVDTAATDYGRNGMGMQIVEEIMDPVMYETLIGAHRGDIFTFTGRMLVFNGVQIQFDLTEIPVYVGSVLQDVDFMHHLDLLEPMQTGTYLLNERLPDSLHQINMQMYSVFAHQYVYLGGLFHRFSNPGAPRPVWAFSGDGDMIGLGDMSLRFRNDREGMYPQHMNYRRLQVDEPFTPPNQVLGTVRGFVSFVTGREPNGMTGPNPTAVVNPWYDGKLWLDGNRFEFGWIPNDVVAEQDTIVIPDDTRIVSFSVSMSSLMENGWFKVMQDRVYLRLSFADWMPLRMSQISENSYRVVVQVPGSAGDTIQYKFFYESPSGLAYNGGWEMISTDPFENRILVLGTPGVDVTLDVATFGYIPIAPPASVLFPMTFENSDIPWDTMFTNFDGGDLTRIENPDKSGINTSDFVARMVKNVGQPWAGAWFRMTVPIDMTQDIFTVRVWSPRADARLLFKLENEFDFMQSVELDQVIGVANQWTDVTFDMSHANKAITYQKVVLIFDLGTVGDGSTNFTFYVDDIRQGVVVAPPVDHIPVYLYTTTRFAPGDADGNWLYIGLGSEEAPAVDLIGMGFRLWFDTTLVIPTAYSTLGMFDDGIDTDYLDLFELTENGAGVSIVRTAGTNKLPYGPVIGIRFNVKDMTDVLDLWIEEIEIRNSTGELVPFNLLSHWINIPTRTTGMWPGDTNADGEVDVFDVEPIAFGFGRMGPARVNRTIQWMEIDAPLWDIRELVHADATGDGVINQNDLLPVGFNFGKSISMMTKDVADHPATRRQESVEIQLPAMREGETLELPLFADPTFSGLVDIRSFAFRLNLDASLVRVESVLPATGFAAPGTLRMIKSEPALNRYSAAYSRTADMGTVSVDGPLIRVLIRALADLPIDATLTIDRSMTAYGDARAMPARLFTPEGIITSVDDPRAQVPTHTRLEANYPNPFNPSTMIHYELSDAVKVRLSVYDVLGREVAVLVDAEQSVGSYQMMFDASGLSSGIYLIRLSAGTETFTRSMTLVK